MNDYLVLVPITGYLEVQVRATDEEEAVDLAIEQGTLDDVVEWNAHIKVVQNGRYNGLLNEAEVIESYENM